MTYLSRRLMVRGTAVLGLGLASGTLLTAPTASAADAADSAGAMGAAAKERPVSLNGWVMEERADDVSTVWTRPVPGTGLTVATRIGDVETVLVHLLRRHHYEIDELRPGDVTGWHHPSGFDPAAAASNLASGTALRIRPGHYPAGTTGGWYPDQLTVVRDILAELDGVVRWGGDDKQPDESLFSIDVAPGSPRLRRLAAELRGWREHPGRGAGVPADPLDADRREAAEALTRKQRATAR
ncbi:hypothetical protein [Streptomyces sp. NPDC096193]|uniref:hypothetical protein n=1 Tax=Streptomyces sp. NPDC096193 TaxID=3155821 RepID=UPI0033294A7E